MKVKYKKSGAISYSSDFNMCALSEVLTGDDSVFISDLDVWLTATNEWKDMHQSFKDRDLITDNYNTNFFEPMNDEDRNRGYTL